MHNPRRSESENVSYYGKLNVAEDLKLQKSSFAQVVSSDGKVMGK